MAPGSLKKPRPLVRPPEKVRVRCIGYYCWQKGKTFMSPDKKRIRMCPRCQGHADAHPGLETRGTYRKSVRGGSDV